MNLTWFGGTTLRVQIGGEIVVCDGDHVPAGLERLELSSGADRAFSLAEARPTIDAAGWQPRRRAPLVYETHRPAVVIHGVAPMSVLIDAVGEAPLLLLSDHVPPVGWGQEAVVVLFSQNLAEAVLREFRPRLMALALAEHEADAVLDSLRERLDGTVLVALEPALAVEI
jgi:hypothetical protein